MFTFQTVRTHVHLYALYFETKRIQTEGNLKFHNANYSFSNIRVK